MEAAFGVIALTGQVVDTSFKIKKVVGTFKSAPEEIRGLSSKLEFVGLTCDSLGKLIDDELRLFGVSSLLDEGVDAVLKRVKESLLKLEEVVNKLESKGSGTKGQKLSFLRKKDDIKTLKEELEEQVSLLQLKLTTATYKKQVLRVKQTSIHDKQPENPISSTTYCTHEPPKQPEESALLKTTRVVLDRFTSETAWLLGIQSLVDNRKVTKKSKWKNGEETITTNETKSLTIRHQSSTYAIQLMWWFTGSMSISCSLTIPHIIDSRTNKQTKWRLYRYCYGGSIRGLQEMFSEKVITPTSLIDGATLFEWAASFPQPDMCRFIMQQNSKLVTDEYLLGSNSHPGRHSEQARGTPDEISQSYVDLVGMCLVTEVPTIIQYRFLVSSMCHPRDMLMCFKKLQYHVFPEEWLDFMEVAWDEAVSLFLKDLDTEYQWMPPGDMYEDWFPLFGRIVDGGVDISRHLGGRKSSRTMLWELLAVTCCPFNLESALSYWRYILWACGVNINEYLAEEWSLSDIMWNSTREEQTLYAWPRKLVQKSIGGHVFPTWERHIDPKSHAFEARQEFKDFGPHKPFHIAPPTPFCEYLAGVNDDQRHRAWKVFSHESMGPVDLEAWPFGFLPARDPWEYHRNWHRWYDSKEEAFSTGRSLDYAQELVRTRFERKLVKKLYRSGYLRKYKRLRDLPGAWNEAA